VHHGFRRLWISYRTPDADTGHSVFRHVALRRRLALLREMAATADFQKPSWTVTASFSMYMAEPHPQHPRWLKWAGYITIIDEPW